MTTNNNEQTITAEQICPSCGTTLNYFDFLIYSGSKRWYQCGNCKGLFLRK